MRIFDKYQENRHKIMFCKLQFKYFNHCLALFPYNCWKKIKIVRPPVPFLLHTLQLPEKRIITKNIYSVYPSQSEKLEKFPKGDQRGTNIFGRGRLKRTSARKKKDHIRVGFWFPKVLLAVWCIYHDVTKCHRQNSWGSSLSMNFAPSNLLKITSSALIFRQTILFPLEK